MIEKFYTKEGKFNYIRYNSLTIFADYVLDYPNEYYTGLGVTVAHDKPIGVIPTNVKKYDSIFINADLIDQCISILSNIDVPFHLITGCADRTIPDDIIEQVLKTKVVTWSAHNLKKYNDKFLQVPIGFDEFGTQRPNTFTEYIEVSESKLIPIIVTPFGKTHDSRSELSNLYGDGILNLKSRISYQEFLTLLALSKYSCCPRGNGLDSHRFAESILCDSIPIVMTSDLDPLYEEMGSIILTDWGVCKYLDSLPIPALNKDTLTLEYWHHRIKDHQQKYEL